ncbi:MAG: hypothetical protein ACLFRG_08300 [Desulfococcaceae bacterium]
MPVKAPVRETTISFARARETILDPQFEPVGGVRIFLRASARDDPGARAGRGRGRSIFLRASARDDPSAAPAIFVSPRKNVAGDPRVKGPGCQAPASGPPVSESQNTRFFIGFPSGRSFWPKGLDDWKRMGIFTLRTYFVF